MKLAKMLAKTLTTDSPSELLGLLVGWWYDGGLISFCFINFWCWISVPDIMQLLSTTWDQTSCTSLLSELITVFLMMFNLSAMILFLLSTYLFQFFLFFFIFFLHFHETNSDSWQVIMQPFVTVHGSSRSMSHNVLVLTAMLPCGCGPDY